MKIFEYKLSGSNQNEISTEVKFMLASARFDGAELMRFVYETNDTDRDATRLRNIVLRVLRSLRARKTIQFFVLPEDFANSTTESEFLLNKYSEHFSNQSDIGKNESYFYIKI